MRDHRRLRAFELADQLVLTVYESTRNFPKEELFGLTSQMRRCAVSIPANIVEGCGRHTEKEYVRFLDMSFGSLRELGYFIDLSNRLGFLTDQSKTVLEARQSELARTLTGLIRSLRNSP